MDTKNIVIIILAILVVVLVIACCYFVLTQNSNDKVVNKTNVTNKVTNESSVNTQVSTSSEKSSSYSSNKSASSSSSSSQKEYDDWQVDYETGEYDEDGNPIYRSEFSTSGGQYDPGVYESYWSANGPISDERIG